VAFSAWVLAVSAMTVSFGVGRYGRQARAALQHCIWGCAASQQDDQGEKRRSENDRYDEATLEILQGHNLLQRKNYMVTASF
jgi:hypothetical protein